MYGTFGNTLFVRLDKLGVCKEVPVDRSVPFFVATIRVNHFKRSAQKRLDRFLSVVSPHIVRGQQKAAKFVFGQNGEASCFVKFDVSKRNPGQPAEFSFKPVIGSFMAKSFCKRLLNQADSFNFLNRIAVR